VTGGEDWVLASVEQLAGKMILSVEWDVKLARWSYQHSSNTPCNWR